MRKLGGWPGMCVLALAAALVAGVAHAVEPYDVEVYKISVEDQNKEGTTFVEGHTLQINCNWSVTKASAASSWPPMSWNSYVKVDGKTIFQGLLEISPPPGPKISKGFGWTWKAQGAGAHTITCGIGAPNLTDTYPKNNEKSAVVQLRTPLKAKTPVGNVAMPPKGVIPNPAPTPGVQPPGHAAPGTRVPVVQQPQVPPNPVQPGGNVPRQ